MTRHRLFGLLVGLTFTAAAQARLGETMPELIDRFGKGIPARKATVYVDGNQREVGTLVAFRYEEWRIDVIMIDGSCARIRYAKSPTWTEQQIATLLEKNAQGLAWKEELATSGRKWTRQDGAIAIWDQASGLALELPSYQQRLNDRKTDPGRGAENKSKRPS